MARTPLALLPSTEFHGPETEDASRESGVAEREDLRRTLRNSSKVRVREDVFCPKIMRSITMDVIAAVYEDSYGYPFDFDRTLASFARSRGDFPRRLVGPLLIELSKRLHPGRRPDFLRTTCETLHQLEGARRVFI